MKNTEHQIQNKSLSAFEIFSLLSIELASGATLSRLNNVLLKYLKVPRFDFDNIYISDLETSGFIGKLIIWGLVKVQPASGDFYETYYLTDLGIKLARNFV